MNKYVSQQSPASFEFAEWLIELLESNFPTTTDDINESGQPDMMRFIYGNGQ